VRGRADQRQQEALFGTQFTLEGRLQGLARVTLVMDYWLDVQGPQGLKQVILAAAGQPVGAHLKT